MLKPKFIYLLRTYLFTGAPVISPDPITVSGLFLCLGLEKMTALVALTETSVELHCVQEDVPYIVRQIVKAVTSAVWQLRSCHLKHFCADICMSNDLLKLALENSFPA